MNWPQFKRRRSVWVSLAGAMLIAGVGWHCASRGPSYQGRSVSYWFDAYPRSPAPAAEAFRSMGSNAVPYLVAQVRRDDSARAALKWRVWLGLPVWWQKRLPQPARPNERQERAASLLQMIGPAAQPAVPDLIASYNRSFLKARGLPDSTPVDWLGELVHPAFILTPAASAALRASQSLGGTVGMMLAHSHTALCASELNALAAIGGDNPQIIPLILASRRDPELEGFAGNFQFYFPALQQRLPDATQLTAAARVAVPALLAGLGDRNLQIRTAAAGFLGRLTPDHPGVIAPLLKLLENFPDSAGESPGNAGPQSGAEEPAFTTARVGITGPNVPPGASVVISIPRTDQDPFLGAVITALRASGFEHERIASSFCRLLAFEAPMWSGNVKAGLTNLAVKSPGAYRMVVQSLKNPDAAVRRGAAEVLGRLGPKAQDAVLLLTELVRDSVEPDRGVRYRAAEALWLIDGQVEPLIPFRIAELQPRRDGGWFAAGFLGKCGARAGAAVPSLIEMLQKNSDNRMRGKAAITLGEIGPAASEAVPALKEALGDEYRNVQEAAAEALKKISPEGKAP